MENSGYFRSPSLSKERIIFVSDDDLWSTSHEGRNATRLTTCRGQATRPHVSPDGQWIAYESNDSGQIDIYLIPIEGGIPKRVTYRGDAIIARWENNSKLLYHSSDESFHLRHRFLYQLDLETFQEKKLNLGPTTYQEDGPEEKALLGRNLGDPARWKRYRGGTAGTIWVDQKGDGDYKQILKNLKSNITHPRWIKERIFFISDHEGVGNIYSCTSAGRGIKRHTHHDDYYVRNFSIKGEQLAYQSGAEIYLLDLATGESNLINIQFHNFGLQAQERFEDAYGNLQDYSLCPESRHIAFLTRGKLFVMPPWSGAPIQLGDERVRYKHPTWRQTDKGKELVAVAMDQDHEEYLVYFSGDDFQEYSFLEDHDWGKIQSLCPSPTTDLLAITTNRNELKLIDLQEYSVQTIEPSPNLGLGGLDWSSDGRYLAYHMHINHQLIGIKIYDFDKDQTQLLFDPINKDTRPIFSTCGKYLFFKGIREFHPTHSETHDEITFPFASKAYAVILQKEGRSPLDEFLEFDDDEDNDDQDQENDQENEDILIDFEGISSRIISLPLEMGGVLSLIRTKDKILYLKRKISGTDPINFRWSDPDPGSDLYSYSFKDDKIEIFHKDVYDFSVSDDDQHILIDTDGELRLLSMDSKPSEGDEFSKKDGWLDLSRIKVRHSPKDEWYQMYQEAWVLQRENFWTQDMSKIDWEDVYIKYLPLLDKVHTRSELSDLMWEMQGELGTSHCYEVEGDYHRKPEKNLVAKLGAEFRFDSHDSSFVIEKIYQGDSWIKEVHSPLKSHRANLQKGDRLLAIDGQGFQSALCLNRLLEGKVQERVNLLIQRKDSTNKESLCVDTLSTNKFLLYREWVEKNRNYVHQKSGGKLGYVHIPDMSYKGFAEFYRYFLSERFKNGLVVDVRFNGGGNVSHHILKILAQKLIGFNQSRHFGVFRYPDYSIQGPLVALTNENAGSDGDIFSHAFKLMGLGKLIGKRTWGGVIGIWPRHLLNDGTWTSQPEFSFWFKDVGYNVENYGTDPDIDIDITPKDWSQGKDPQLDKAIEVAMQDLKKNPPLRLPENEKRPNLKIPKLPRK